MQVSGVVNIFVLDRDPAKAARYHCDKHVVKMLLETAQLLSTALWHSAPQRAAELCADGRIYRATHANHPCALWARESAANFRWLMRLGQALAVEYHYRYGDRAHASEVVLESCAGWAVERADETAVLWAGRQLLTPFAQAMPDEYLRADPVEAYRAYYRGAKAHIARWTRRRPPSWFSCESEKHGLES